MDRLQEMQVFLAVTETLSLAAAARRLNMSTPTATRAIDALEQRLGTDLLMRSTRGVKLSEAGQRFAPDCQRILQQLQEAEASACGMHSEPRGRLCLSAPLLFGQQLLTPIVLEYLQQFTDVQITSRYIDRTPHLHEEGIDVAILAGNLPDSSLFAVRVGSIRRVICASPAYLTAHGTPETPQQLQQHRIIHSTADARLPEWRFRVDDESCHVSFVPRLSCSTNLAAINAARYNAGLCRCMSYQIHEFLVNGELQTVLTDYELPAIPVHIVYREGRKAAARVRSFVDFAASRLRGHPALG